MKKQINKNKYNKIRNLTIRIEAGLLDKLHYAADYDGRSANSQVLYLIRKYIKEHEKENGVIDFNVKEK